MPGELKGKVGLITGGGSGIGRATALAFARAGAKVAIADMDAAGGQETAKQLAAAGSKALFVEADVSRPADAARMVADTVKRFGRLDCAFNNAGIGGGMLAATADYEEEAWDRVIAVNLKGVFLCMKSELKAMLAQGGGAIVNNASVAGLIGSRVGCAYTASKHGVIGLTRAAAIEYAPAGIRVNAVCPSWIETPLTERAVGNIPEMKAQIIARQPTGRLGTVDEVAAAVVWLCSDAASFITAHPLPVDGGFVAQ